jgi:hypothetical protein
MKAIVTIRYPKNFITSKEQLTSSSGYQFFSMREKRAWYRVIAEGIYNISQVLVPVDTGALKESGRIRENADGTFRVEYTMPYAVFVHEILEHGHMLPTQAKFLEDAAYMYLAQISQETDESLPLFTFHLEMGTDIGVVLYIDNISMDEFLGWVKDTWTVPTFEEL